MIRRLPGLLCALARAGAAAGCGGGESTNGDAADPATWAAGFCQALTRFSDGIAASGKGLEGEGPVG